MFHECKDVKIILIANGWPENGIKITHYSSTQREDENRNLIPNFNREWPKKKPYIFLDPMRAKEEAEGMVLDRQKRILHFQYDEVSTEINIMEKKMEDMKKKMEDMNNDIT